MLIYKTYLIKAAIDVEVGNSTELYYLVSRANGSKVTEPFDNLEAAKKYIDLEIWTKSEYFGKIEKKTKNDTIVALLLEGAS